MVSLIDDVHAFCRSEDPTPWIESSALLKSKLRSFDEKDKRRKRMRIYQPSFPYFSDPDHVKIILSRLNK